MVVTTTPLARRLLQHRAEPCGVAVARCFPDSSKVQAALAEYHEAFADIVTAEAPFLVCIAEYLADAHGLQKVLEPSRPAIGVASLRGRQAFVLFDGRHWWAIGQRGIGVIPSKAVLSMYEVA